MGRALIKAVGRIEATRVESALWYRCIRDDRGRPLVPEDFNAPTEDQEWQIREGRFNHAGQPHWYVADSERTAIAEVLDDEGGVVFVQCFRVGPCAKVLDLYRSLDEDDGAAAETVNLESALAIVMMGEPDRYVDRKHAWKPGYLLPRFVMDAAKLAGFQGIKYRSTRASSGANLVLFNGKWPADYVGEPVRHEQEAHEPASVDGDLVEM